MKPLPKATVRKSGRYETSRKRTEDRTQDYNGHQTVCLDGDRLEGLELLADIDTSTEEPALEVTFKIEAEKVVGTDSDTPVVITYSKHPVDPTKNINDT